MRCSSSLVKDYLIEPIDKIFMNGYGFMSSAKNITKIHFQ